MNVIHRKADFEPTEGGIQNNNIIVQIIMVLRDCELLTTEVSNPYITHLLIQSTSNDLVPSECFMQLLLFNPLVSSLITHPFYYQTVGIVTFHSPSETSILFPS